MFNQVNKIFKRSYKLFQRHNDFQLGNLGKVLYPLENRKILKVAGPDAVGFLQGLITNDMRHFEDGVKSMYTMFLNNKGRVLYDTMIHKSNEDYMIECDKTVISTLQRHLKLYKLKRKVEIEDVSPKFKLWAFIPDQTTTDLDHSETDIKIYKDPRLADLGYRMLTPTEVTSDKLVGVVGEDVTVSDCDKGYKYLRYKLGVSEGADDLPPGTSFPLEANCDYLHGVSFHKGCYIGQELTARVHHTGVVRKRIMTIRFIDEVKDLDADTPITINNNPKSNLGKLRGYVGEYGLALVRIKEALESKELIIGKYAIEVLKPSWWPIEAPKEKATAIKQE